ncbi:MAG: SDR family oxidoreductase [Oscillospiraceae bacterium]|jgi:dTDP-4-dehydrorhamnose reductase|nr:SDR family oxidoreductase [Oscillospiraceae bacterium]
MKRIIVLGGTGMAGHVLATYLNECSYDVISMSRSVEKNGKMISIDAEDILSLSNSLDLAKPDVIINCIGILIGESNERPDRAILLNSYLPKFLERKYIDKSVKIIHLSTDCVFSGKKGSYIESDIPDGETVYERTKFLGEINNNKDLTLRMSIIGPDLKKNSAGLFNWFMNQKNKINGFTRAMWNGVTTIELARAVHAAIIQDLSGLYHLVPNEYIDKHNLLLLLQDIFNKTDVLVEPYDDYVIDKTLLNTRDDFDFIVKPYKEQINDMRDWVRKHKDLYNHYKVK